MTHNGAPMNGEICSQMANTALPQLLYLETIAAKWLCSQEKAIAHDISKGMKIVEPL